MIGGVVAVLAAASLVAVAMSSGTTRCTTVAGGHGPHWSSTASVASAHRLLIEYFPQSLQCGSWHKEYAEMHADVLAGRRPPRYLISLSPQTGIADRLVGMVTQLYLAILSDRALTAVTYGDLPRFEAACAAPFINWTHPTPLEQHLVAPFIEWRRDMRWKYNYTFDPAAIDTSQYAALYSNNGAPYKIWKAGNVSNEPDGKPETPYVIGYSNRGRSFVLANNPYHKSQFFRMGISPGKAFMCGMLFLCTPNEAVQALYQRYWDVLKDDKALKIGVNIRIGEHVYKGEGEYNATTKQAMLDKGARFFDCAAKLEKAFALPGQRVVWFLTSDSLLLRKAAADEYGDKILTDLERKPVHPDCRSFNPEECQEDAMNLAMVHSIGQMFTFSMADYHILPQNRGFARVGAWLSGRWKNVYELPDDDSLCDPATPTDPEASSVLWAGV